MVSTKTRSTPPSQPSSLTPNAAQPGLSGEPDEWRAAKLARQRFAQSPFGFEDVFSWILLVLAVIFGIVAAYKGYGIDDAYPGYGELDRHLKSMRAIYEAAKADYSRVVDQFFDRTLQNQARLLSEVKSNIEYYQKLVAKT